MRRTGIIAVMAGLALGAAGCTGNPFDDGVSDHHVGGLDFLSRNPELDLVVVRTPDDLLRVCLSAETDAAPTRSAGLTIGYQGATDSAASGRGVALLAGRSPAVLMARELLYRTCEFSLNYALSKDEALALYRDTMDKVAAIAASDTAAGAAAMDAAPPAIQP